jgi:hypothetical protein
VIRIDNDADIVRLGAFIATRQQRHDAVRSRVERTNQDVEVAVVVREARFGALRWLDVLLRIELPEAVHRRRVAPERIVGDTVDVRGCLRPHGGSDGRRYGACRG